MPDEPLTARLRGLRASLAASAPVPDRSPGLDLSGLTLLLKPDAGPDDQEEWRALTTYAVDEDAAWAEYAGRSAFSGVQSDRGRKGAQIAKISRAVERGQARRAAMLRGEE
jgi:hypothetical protein